MATFTWLGGGSNSFDTATEWMPNGPPADGDTVIMPSGLAMVIGGGTLSNAVFSLGSNDAVSLDTATIVGGSITAGAGFTLDATGSTLENTGLGAGSGSTISLTGSTLLSVDGDLVDGSDGAEQATVDAGASVSVTGTLIIGGSAGAAGALVVNGGGTVSVRAGRTGAFQGVVLGDAAATTSLAAATGSLSVGGGSGSAVLDDVGDFVDGAFGQAGARITAGGTVTVGGTLFIGSVSPLSEGVGTVEVSGGLLTAADVQLSPGSTLDVAVAGAVVAIGGASAVQGIDVAPGATLFGAGLVSGNLLDNGAVVAEVPLGALQLVGGSITGSGSLVVAAAGTLDIFTTVHYGNPVAFSGPAGVLRLELPAALQGSISGFGVGDAIDLPGVRFPPAGTLSYDGAAGVLHFGTQDTFDVGTGYFAQNFALHPEPLGGTGTEIVFVACFAAGTRVLTARGEAAVDELRPGDALPAVSGRVRRVRWVGRTRVALDGHSRPERVAPVRIAAGAFGPGVPHAPLLLSPDHAVFAGGVLIPVHLLVNGGSVAREPGRGAVEYVHLELERHDGIVAEGLRAESYLDTGNRELFAEAEAAAARAAG